MRGNRIPLRLTFFWEVEGKPVGWQPWLVLPARGIVVNAVYTAPDDRHGYATALVAALSAEGLGRGKGFCSCYTDLTERNLQLHLSKDWVRALVRLEKLSLPLLKKYRRPASIALNFSPDALALRYN